VNAEPAQCAPEPVLEPIAIVVDDPRLAAVLASIDPVMESAATAGVIDHSSQIDSWTPEAVAEETLLAETVAALEDAFGFVPVSVPVENAPKTLNELLAAVPANEVDRCVYAVAEALDKRAKFQTDKNADNIHIQKAIVQARKQLVTKRAARFMCAIDVTPTFLNRSRHAGSHYNVYAIGKLDGADAGGLRDGGARRRLEQRGCQEPRLHPDLRLPLDQETSGDARGCVSRTKARARGATAPLFVAHPPPVGDLETPWRLPDPDPSCRSDPWRAYLLESHGGRAKGAARAGSNCFRRASP
jgi:hypothetical protein